MSPRKKRRLLLFLVFLIPASLFCVSVTLFLQSETFNQQIKGYLIARLDQISGGKTSVGSLTISLFPLRVLVMDLTIRGADGDPRRPFLFIQEVSLKPRFQSLFTALRLSDVELRKPEIFLEVRSDGSTNLPRPSVTKLRILDLYSVAIERLRISGGKLRLNELTFDLETELDNLSLLARYNPALYSYRAQLTYQNGKFRSGGKSWKHDLELSAEFLNNEIRVERLSILQGQSELEAQGRFRDIESPYGQLSYRGFLALDSVKEFYPGIRNMVGGTNFSGKFEYAQNRWKAEGKIEGKKLSINTVKIGQFSSRYLIEPNRAHFDRIKISGLHGKTEGSFTIDSPFQSRLYTADLKFKEIGLLDLSLIAHLDKLKFAGLINGTLKASWEDQWRKFTGDGQLAISEAAGEAGEHQINEKILPLSGQMNFALTRRSSTFENSHLKFANSQIEFVGTLSPDDTSNIRLELQSKDLSDLSFVFPELGGKASFIGTLQGSIDTPEVRGSFVADGFSYKKYLVSHVSGQIEANRQEISLGNFSVAKNNSKVLVEGKVFLDPNRYLLSGAVHLLLKVRDAAAEDLYALLGEKFPASGVVSGDFTATGRYPQINLQGVARVRQGTFLDQPYDSGYFELQFLDPGLDIKNFQVSLGRGQVNGTAKLDVREQSVHSTISAHDLPLDRIQALNISSYPISGIIRELSLKADGTLGRPALEGNLQLNNITVDGEPVGDFRSEFHTHNQVLSFSTISLRPGIELKARGTIDLNEDYELEGNFSFQNFMISPYIKRVLPVAPEKLSSRASGQVSISGSLRHVEKLNITGAISALKIDFREAQLQASKAFDFQVQDGKVLIHDASFSGRGTSLSLNGFIELSRKRQLDLTMAGDFDLALLNEFAKKVGATGNGKLNARIRGTLNDPRIQGDAIVEGRQFSYEEFPNSLSQFTAKLFFDENQIKIDSLTGSSGGGKVQVNGDIIFSQETINLVNLKIEAREVRFRYPEGMRSVLDADLTLRGSQRSQLLAGNVRILSASFLKDYDPITEFLENHETKITLPGSKDLGESLSLDLSITGDRNIKLDTAVFKITSRADLKVRGTAIDPLITGSIDASGGELFFQGARYRITRGRIDFINPVRFDPHIDLEAEADVRDYRIVLTINGTADKLHADLRSDPPLPTVDLFSLVSTGGSGVSGASSTAYLRPFPTTGRQQDSSVAAASLLSEGLSLKVGSRVKRIFGLDRFRVDPFLVGAERDPTARVTVGQQITKDLSITYSTSVSSNEQQVIILEYDINNSTSIIASRDDEGALGLDIRFRKRLRQKNR